jgi:quercetin dioxygenase-like cupin family protein
MDIKRNGSQPSTKGSAEYFTGTVRIDLLFQANDPARAVGASVTFEPGSRTVWHTHPLGQILIVTAGCGLVQRWCHVDHGHDPYRHSGTARLQDGRLDGEGQRRTISGESSR